MSRHPQEVAGAVERTPPQGAVKVVARPVARMLVRVVADSPEQVFAVLLLIARAARWMAAYLAAT
jgi:hypothetical protein